MAQLKEAKEQNSREYTMSLTLNYEALLNIFYSTYGYQSVSKGYNLLKPLD